MNWELLALLAELVVFFLISCMAVVALGAFAECVARVLGFPRVAQYIGKSFVGKERSE